jgi:hypothetical protein
MRLKHQWIMLAGTMVGLAGCSSSSVSKIPAAVPLIGSADAQETRYAGILRHVYPGLGPSRGWRISNANPPGSVPVDVTQIAAAARALNGQMVVISAHTIVQPSGRNVLFADRIAVYKPPAQ